MKDSFGMAEELKNIRPYILMVGLSALFPITPTKDIDELPYHRAMYNSSAGWNVAFIYILKCQLGSFLQ